MLALALVIPAPTLGTAAALLFWPGGPGGQVLFVAAKIWIALLPLFWRRWVDRQPLSVSPPRRGGWGVAALTGMVIGAMILAAFHLVLRLGWLDPHTIVDRAALTKLDQPGFYLAGAVYWITLNSLMEEYVWRWFVFRKFEVLTGGMWAVGLAALAFTLHHVIALAAYFDGPIVLLGSLGVFVGGLTWSGLYLRYRSVWPCYLSHALVDLSIFWIGYDLIFRRGG